MDVEETPTWWSMYGEREGCCPELGAYRNQCHGLALRIRKVPCNSVTRTAAARTTKGGTKVNTGGPESSRLRHLRKAKNEDEF